ncbi:hypothetical protein K435DRAFT_851401 [Dendrothele bispora CBS 962.96]|uniref:Uncharacterized protein n=1 Tax=Dendrothele bispora (strain CBS 962.96) TaxID=1314807 RepID=A0A4S8MMB7_DENBC|nr:hypothetical protein K435DRAFT_851401 [Dendrothele bispora CBS 962.96]
MSEPTTTSTTQDKEPSNANNSKSEIISFCSRHSAGIEECLSRYKRKWYLTYSRAYGIAQPPGTRIVCSLNVPDEKVSEEHAKRHFWLNPETLYSAPYKPDDPDYATQKFISSPIHILLDAEPSIVRLTGRTRAEKSRARDAGGKQVACFEVEVTIPEEGLLRQCYYCLGWEDGTERYKPCGDDMFWCPRCESKGSLASGINSTFEKLTRDSLIPFLDRYSFPRDNLYNYS